MIHYHALGRCLRSEASAAFHAVKVLQRQLGRLPTCQEVDENVSPCPLPDIGEVCEVVGVSRPLAIDFAPPPPPVVDDDEPLAVAEPVALPRRYCLGCDMWFVPHSALQEYCSMLCSEERRRGRRVA